MFYEELKKYLDELPAEEFESFLQECGFNDDAPPLQEKDMKMCWNCLIGHDGWNCPVCDRDSRKFNEPVVLTPYDKIYGTEEIRMLLEKINAGKLAFLMECGKEPTQIYLGEKEIELFNKECEGMTFFTREEIITEIPRSVYNGMEIFKVEAKSHIGYSR